MATKKIATTTPIPAHPNRALRIYVLQQRWVLMGYVEKETRDEVIIVDSNVIRIWGTTMGLGQIALQGPTKDTKLDPCGRVTIPMAAILFSIDCIYEKK